VDRPQPLPDTWRWVIVLSLVVVAVAGAVTVFVVGSHNRKADRQRVLSYETQALAHVREMNVVAGSLADAVAAYRAGRATRVVFARSVAVYATSLHTVERALATLRPPAAVGTGAEPFGTAARLYASAADDARTAAACPARTCADEALARYDRDAADALARYHRAVLALQDARARLGLERSPNFGDPPR
jgi:hypothetical protein